MTILGFLIDLDGVVSINDEPIQGAVFALQRMRTEGIPFRFDLNNTHRSRQSIANRLEQFGVSVPRSRGYVRRLMPRSDISEMWE